MTDSPRVAVVGVGNPIMGDDGVGRHVVDALHELEVPPRVEVTHAGTTAFLALEALSGADRGIVVDAISVGEAEPGTLHRYRLVDGSFEGEVPDVFMHDFSFSEAVKTGSQAYDLPPDVLVLGVEPADTSAGVGLSDPLETALPTVVETVYEQATQGDRRPVGIEQAVRTSAIASDLQPTTETRQ